jgi:hypothetical protein
MAPRAVGIGAGRGHDGMKTRLTEPQQLANDDEDGYESEDEDEEDAPAAPDEEPDGQPDPAFD